MNNNMYRFLSPYPFAACCFYMEHIVAWRNAIIGSYKFLLCISPGSIIVFEHEKVLVFSWIGKVDCGEIKRKIARLEIDLKALEITELRILSSVSGGGNPGPESSILKLNTTRLEQSINEVSVDILGYRGFAMDPVPGPIRRIDPDLVLGIQANLWGERMQSFPHVLYMTWPRACAVSEIGWSPERPRDYAGFFARLQVHLGRLDAAGINYRKPTTIDRPE